MKVRELEQDGLICDENKYLDMPILANALVSPTITKYLGKGVTPDQFCSEGTNSRLEVDNDAPFGLSQDISIFSEGLNDSDSDDGSTQRNATRQCIVRCEEKKINLIVPRMCTRN